MSSQQTPLCSRWLGRRGQAALKRIRATAISKCMLSRAADGHTLRQPNERMSDATAVNWS
jgi:hypothetical protein